MPEQVLSTCELATTGGDRHQVFLTGSTGTLKTWIRALYGSCTSTERISIFAAKPGGLSRIQLLMLASHGRDSSEKAPIFASHNRVTCCPT